jgi:ankyrin repeat protein
MSEPSRRDSRHLQQQHKLAKDLIRNARAGDAAALTKLRVAFPGQTRFRLADAQLVIARDAGFESWLKLIRHVEQQEQAAAAAALHHGDAAALRRLLAGSEYLRAQINAPLFDFGRRAIHVAANRPDVVDVLIEFGANPNQPSDWEKGPYVPLDEANETAARHLVNCGAELTANVAARLGWIDELRTILDADPKAIRHRGGDGKMPLHEAAKVEIADLLLDRGAEIDARCFDHHSTPAQYALKSRVDVCRRLLARGATADIFMAARLGDADLAQQILARDPAAAGARVNLPGYEPVPPFNIYCWELGWYKSPAEVARECGHIAVAELIDLHSDPKTQFVNAAWAGDEAAARRLIASNPQAVSQLTSADHKLLAQAAHLRRDEAFLLMLELGFDPNATGLDGGTALHQAAWTGGADLVAAVLKTGKCDLEQRDPTHGATPLSWAAHGSNNCRHRRGDYLKTVELLATAGARMDVPANSGGISMIEQAKGNAAVQDLLRKLGAT